jgi:hypothetical protein
MFIAQAQQTAPSGLTAMLLVAAGLGLAMAFMPLWIASVRHRSTLVVWAVIFTVLSAAFGVTALVGATGNGALFGIVWLYGFGVGANAAWLIALLLGLAAAIDGMAERRAKRAEKLADHQPQRRPPLPIARRYEGQNQ